MSSKASRNCPGCLRKIARPPVPEEIWSRIEESDRTVLRHQLLEKTRCRLASGLDPLPFHGKRRIENEGHDQPPPLAREVGDLLRLAVLQHGEIRLLEPLDQLPGTVSHRDVEVDQVHA